MRDRLNLLAEMIVLLAALAIIAIVGLSLVATTGCNAWHLDVAREQAEMLRACELRRDVCLDRLEACEHSLPEAGNLQRVPETRPGKSPGYCEAER